MSRIGKLKSESGHAEAFFLILVLGISAAILIPALLRTLNEVMSRECLAALASAASQEIEIGEARCPVPDVQVKKEEVEGVERYFLSGSEERFPTSPVFLRSEGKLVFEQSFPQGDAEAVGWSISNLDGMQFETGRTLTELILGLIVVLLFVLLIWVAYDWGCLPVLIVLVPALFVFVANLIVSKSIQIDPSGTQVRIATTYLGVLKLEPILLANPVALVPDGYETANVILLHESDGKLHTSHLLALDNERLSSLAVADTAFRRSKSGDSMTPLAAGEALHEPAGEEEPPVKSAPADAGESWWSVLFGISGKALPHLGRALLHLLVLVIGSLLIFFLAAGIAGLESFSLPFDQVFIVTVLGTGLSPFFGWTSTGIILAVYAVLCTAGALYERFQ